MEVSRRDLVRAGLALSATSAVSGSAIARANTLLFTNSGIASAEAFAGVPPREQLLLDFGWKFILGSACDALRDLGFGKAQDDFSKTGNFEFATGKFDDTQIGRASCRE